VLVTSIDIIGSPTEGGSGTLRLVDDGRKGHENRLHRRPLGKGQAATPTSGCLHRVIVSLSGPRGIVRPSPTLWAAAASPAAGPFSQVAVTGRVSVVDVLAHEARHSPTHGNFIGVSPCCISAPRLDCPVQGITHRTTETTKEIHGGEIRGDQGLSGDEHDGQPETDRGSIEGTRDRSLVRLGELREIQIGQEENLDQKDQQIAGCGQICLRSEQ